MLALRAASRAGIPRGELRLYLAAPARMALKELSLGGGALIIGLHETLPMVIEDLQPWPQTRAVFRRIPVPVSPQSHSADEPLWQEV